MSLLKGLKVSNTQQNPKASPTKRAEEAEAIQKNATVSRSKIEDVKRRVFEKEDKRDSSGAKKNRWRTPNVTEYPDEEPRPRARDDKKNGERRKEHEEKSAIQNLSTNDACEEAISAFISGNFKKFNEISTDLDFRRTKNFMHTINIEDNEELSEAEQALLERAVDQDIGVHDEFIEKSFKQDLLNERNPLLIRRRSSLDEDKRYDLTQMTDNFDSLVEKKISGKKERKMVKKDEKRMFNEYKRSQRVLANCNYCYDNVMGKIGDILLSESENVYLCLPLHTVPFTDDQCCIIPKEHYSSVNQTDENVYEEIRNFQKSLVAYYASQNKTVLFVEYVNNISKVPHTLIDCIPLREEIEGDAKIYFSKALSEQDEEWASHKKLIDTTKKKGKIHDVIPTQFNYIHIDFAGSGGFAHVIEDSRKFTSHFAEEIIAGMFGYDITELNMLKKQSKLEHVDRRDKFLEAFNEFDWTNYVKKRK